MRSGIARWFHRNHDKRKKGKRENKERKLNKTKIVIIINKKSGSGRKRSQPRKLSEKEVDEIFDNMFEDYRRKLYNRHRHQFSSKSLVDNSSSDCDSNTAETIWSDMSSLTSPSVNLSKTIDMKKHVSHFVGKINCCFTVFHVENNRQRF